MWIKYDPNPVTGERRGDCVIRALTIASGKSWDMVYWELCHLGRQFGDWGNSNTVWRKYLRDHGYWQYSVPNTCPVCYTIRDFCVDYPHGVYIVCTGARDGDHVVAVKDGDYYDSWDSGHASRQETMDHLRMAIESAPDEETRRVLEATMSNMERA